MERNKFYFICCFAICFLWQNRAVTDVLVDGSPDQLIDFAVGRSLFEKLWVAAPASTKASDGLGPLYNARSCFQCHINAGRGKIPNASERAVSIFMRLSIPPQNKVDKEKLGIHRNNVIAEPNYGTQFQTFAVTGLAAEGRLKINYTDLLVELSGGETIVLQSPTYQLVDLQYGDLHPDTMVSPRLAPQLIGMGLLADIKEADILQYNDPDDINQDGISGKANRVWSKEFNKVLLGRFGYKAGVATLNEQNQRAFVNDLGLSTPLFKEPWGDCTTHQLICKKAPHGDDTSQQNLEAPQKITDAVLHFISQLEVSAQYVNQSIKNTDHIKGKTLFIETGCIACHRPSYELDEQTIYPYTDMLLHNMGEGLADDRPEGEANGQEWRTAPLWGIGLTEHINGHHYYLHDGRARSLQEAILWHGGEAKKVRDSYRKLSKKDRQLLLNFLGKL